MIYIIGWLSIPYMNRIYAKQHFNKRYGTNQIDDILFNFQQVFLENFVHIRFIKYCDGGQKGVIV